jgi:hypothetical protein
MQHKGVKGMVLALAVALVSVLEPDLDPALGLLHRWVMGGA